MHRRTLLVVAPGPPDFDRHAGSRRLYAWLQILSAEYEIAFYMLRPRFDAEAHRYAQALRALGIRIQRHHARALEHLASQIDHGVLFEFFHTAERLLPSLRLLRPDLPMAVSCADLHYVREARAAVYAERPRAARAKVRRTRRRELGVYRRADLVVTVTEADRRILTRAVSDAATAVVPSTFPVAQEAPAFAQRIPRSLLFVGGFRHPPNVDAMLFFCRDVLPRIQRTLPDVRVSIVGDAPPREVQALASAHVTVTGWVPDVQPYLASHAVSIAPLRCGSGLKGKIVEAMAAGLPVVTTPMGAEGTDLTHGDTALIAESAEGFAEAVVQLCTDGDLHARLSRQSLAHARSRWDPSEVAPRLLETIGSMRTLTPKRLGVLDRAVHAGRVTYESSSVPERVDRLSSYLRWYFGRLRTASPSGP